MPIKGWVKIMTAKQVAQGDGNPWTKTGTQKFDEISGKNERMDYSTHCPFLAIKRGVREKRKLLPSPQLRQKGCCHDTRP